MNNPRLLAGLLCAALLGGGGACAGAQSVMTLEEIFSVAEANSAQLRPSRTAREEARREIGVARADMLPELNAALSLSYIGDGFTTRRDLSDIQKAPIPHLGNGLSLTLNQPLYAGGALKSAVELAELKSTAARFAEDFQRDNIRFRLAGFYLDLYKCANLRKVVDGNITAARKVLDGMHARHEQGTALQNDITRYELMLSNLELQQVRLDNTLDILNANLVETAGLPEGTVVVPDPSLPGRTLPQRGEAQWQELADACSPTLNLARSGVDISRKAESLVRAGRLPKIGLQAGWSIDGPILVEVPPVDRNLSYWYVGVGVSFNISSLYKTDKALARSRAASLRAAQELDAARQDVSLTVRADHIRYLEACEELKTRSKSVELAERNYDTTATRYEAGMALITDMLDAANARLDAGQQLVNARINAVYYYYKLLFTTGQI